MNVGGTRLLRIAPRLAYGDQGVQGIIPPNAILTTELSVIAARSVGQLQ
jgi:FKBP-type peptidyl-prolyl cis-trans isomerase